MKKYIKAEDDFGTPLQVVLDSPSLEFEISECNASLDEIIEAVEREYPDFRFSRTEERYYTCLMAVFEKV